MQALCTMQSRCRIRAQYLGAKSGVKAQEKVITRSETLSENYNDPLSTASPPLRGRESRYGWDRAQALGSSERGAEKSKARLKRKNPPSPDDACYKKRNV
jgi:hypothetical protein